MSHGHDDGHGHGAVPAGDSGGHGPAEIPPVPETRVISPARADYAQPFVGRGLLWPVLWLAVAFCFHAAAKRWPGEPHEPAGAVHEAPGAPHASPAGEHPAAR